MWRLVLDAGERDVMDVEAEIAGYGLDETQVSLTVEEGSVLVVLVGSYPSSFYRFAEKFFGCDLLGDPEFSRRVVDKKTERI